MSQTVTMTLTEFLLARLAAEDAAWSGGAGLATRPGFASLSRHMLRDCEAKRRIVELHDGAHECSGYDHTGQIDNCRWYLDGDDCSTLRVLAAVYSDHPDYDAAWKSDRA